MRPHRGLTTIIGMFLAVGLAACGDDDGDGGSAEAPPDAGGLEVSSAAFADGEPIPQRYTCDGDDVSPPFAVAGVPDGTAELAIVMRDPDAGGYVHWVIAGIPAGTTAIAEDEAPAGAVEAQNGSGQVGWAGPCPPDGNHTYEFTVYALGEASGLEEASPAEDGIAAIEGVPALATATLRGTYERS